MVCNENTKVLMGLLPPEWNPQAKNITFCVTEDCNLACKYCYMTGKNNKNRLDFETAKEIVDFYLSNREYFNEPAVIWEFIGGEPFMEIELIDKICDYIKKQMFVLDHPWFNAYRFNFSSNGLLYSDPKVQEYIKKNRTHVNIGLSVDGNKIKHDLQRVKPDGSGSYDDVVANVPLWLEQFPGAVTKATFAHDDLPYLKDSVISLWDLGIKVVSANVIFEPGWVEGDDIILENQLKELADYILEKEIWSDHSVRFFDPAIGFPLQDEEKKHNFCGSGRMIASDTKGNLYPCIRFYDISLNNREGLSVGNIYDGIDEDKLRPFLQLSLQAQSTEECIQCEVASGCAWCTGCNYDFAETDTLFQRATFICEMHKATVRANIYFWDKFEKVTGLVSERRKRGSERNPDKTPLRPYLQIMTSDNITPNCCYENWNGTNAAMSQEDIQKGLDYASQNGYIPIILGDASLSAKERKKFNTVSIYNNSGTDSSKSMFVSKSQDALESSDYAILVLDSSNIEHLGDYVRDIIDEHNKVEIILNDIDNLDYEKYNKQLEVLSNYIYEVYDPKDTVQINILTDLLQQKYMNSCMAGENTFTLAPNGRIYICPAFYFDNPEEYIGTLEDGIHIKNSHVMKIENALVCSTYCDAYQCKRCKFLNKKRTGEYNTPSKKQCEISHIERNHAYQLQQKLIKNKYFQFFNRIKPIDYTDPMEILKQELLLGGNINVD